MDENTIQLLNDRCPECRSTNLIRNYETGENICGNCGLVIQDLMMDAGPEWRAFTQEEKDSRSRVGIPPSYSVQDKGLSTSISSIERDAFGRKLPLSTRLQMWRLRKWQYRSRVHSSIERNLVQAMAELDRISDKVSVPGPVKEKAAVIYRKALDKGLVRGRTIAAIVAASLYAACRITSTPRNLREISRASLSSRNDVARDYRLLLRELDIRMPIVDPMIYLSKVAEKANVSSKTIALAAKILQEAKQKHASAGPDPTVLVASALYIAALQCGEKKTQKEIAEAAGVTEVAVRNNHRALKRRLNLELPD